MKATAAQLELAASIDAAESVAIASQLVAIPSFTGEETALAHHIRDLSEANSIPTELQEVEPGRYQVIAWLGPRDVKPALMLNGHLDIDPLDRQWSDSPFVADLDGDKLYGAGLHNMKAGLTSMIAAALALRRSGMQLQRTVRRPSSWASSRAARAHYSHCAPGSLQTWR